MLAQSARRKVAQEFKIPLLLITDVNHLLQSDYAEVITVGQGADAVDALINRTRSGDIVVSQDYGLATWPWPKRRRYQPRGLIYSDKNIDRLLFQRHLAQKQRRARGRLTPVPARRKEDDRAFERNFRNLIQQARRP